MAGQELEKNKIGKIVTKKFGGEVYVRIIQNEHKLWRYSFPCKYQVISTVEEEILNNQVSKMICAVGIWQSLSPDTQMFDQWINTE